MNIPIAILRSVWGPSQAQSYHRTVAERLSPMSIHGQSGWASFADSIVRTHGVRNVTPPYFDFQPRGIVWWKQVSKTLGPSMTEDVDDLTD